MQRQSGVALLLAIDLRERSDAWVHNSGLIADPDHSVELGVADRFGLDFNADYVMPLFNGMMNWHLVGNYTDEQTQNAAGINFDYAGSLSQASSVSGTPKFKTTLSSTYAEGAWSGTVQGRVIG